MCCLLVRTNMKYGYALGYDVKFYLHRINLPQTYIFLPAENHTLRFLFSLMTKRIDSLDLLRGLVMILMALDHTRDFFHIGVSQGVDATDFTETSAVLFMTRWITHFCAPVFVFLAGTSIGLMSFSKSPKDLSVFLITRGLWLCFLEVTVVYFGWVWSFNYPFLALQVIWAIGLSMFFTGILIHLPRTIFIILTLVIIFGHNLLDSITTESDGFSSFLWAVLHEQRGFDLSGHRIFIVYPFLPWLGLMMAGVLLADWYTKGFDPIRRKVRLFIAGVGCILLFVLLRTFTSFGEPEPWIRQSTRIFDMLSFVNTSKYPPSLLFILMTIGPALIFLSVTESVQNVFSKICIVFGRVPMFYYILHLYFIHIGAFLLFYLQGYTQADLAKGGFTGFPETYGLGLAGVYGVWVLIVALLYLPCLWYGRLKQKSNNSIFSYL